MFSKFIARAGLFAGLFLFATATVSVSIQACSPGQSGQEDVQPKDTTVTLDTDDPCNSDGAYDFCLALCQNDEEELQWEGLFSSCFNQGCQTSWEPALGFMFIRCEWQICQAGFEWKEVENICEVPDNYQWSVQKSWNFWEGTLTFEPDECLAELIPNHYYFNIRGTDCPY